MGPVGCATNGAGNGTGGTAGAGTGGTAGTGGSPIVFCEPTNDRCMNGTIQPHEPCCEQEVPDQANACNGTESTENPTACTATGATVTYRLTLIELESDCNVGYDLDACEGQSCVPIGLRPAEGMSGVDNALAGSASIWAGIGADLWTFNQALSGSVCGLAAAYVCDGGDNDGDPCSRDNECAGVGARCAERDCVRQVPPTEIRFEVDANASEGCANVTVLADGEASAHILNLSDDGCASGTLGTIPIPIHGIEVSLENTVVRMTVSSEGFSHGLLGSVMDVMDASILWILFGDRVEAAIAVSMLDINASTPPVQDASANCNGLSATFVIGGVAQ
jgi:hypothetical protein